MASAPSSKSPVAVGRTTGTGFHGLVARYPLEQAIPPTPQAPKKNRLATSCAAVLSPVQFNLGGDNEPKWLRYNHRVDPKMHKAKVSSDKPRRAEKRKAGEFNFHWQITIDEKKKKQKSNDFTLSNAHHRSASCERLATDADEKDTSPSKND